MLKPDSPEIIAFVQHASAVLDTELPAPKDVLAFGNTAAMKDELLALLVAGVKRATTSWPIPDPVFWEVGDISVVLDGSDVPMAIFRTTELERVVFKDVSAQFAFDEGEDDKSLETWSAGHIRYFTREDPKFSEDEIVLCERFELVYPPSTGV